MPQYLAFKCPTGTHIYEINPYRHENGSYQIVADAKKNDKQFQQLSEALIAAGFPKSEFADNHFKMLRLLTTDIQQIGCFLKVLKKQQDTIADIMTPIVNAISNNALNAVPTLKQLCLFSVERDQKTLDLKKVPQELINALQITSKKPGKE